MQSSPLRLVLLIFLLACLTITEAGGPAPGGGFRLGIFETLHQWSRKFFDFAAATPLATKFLSGRGPPTTQFLIEQQGYPCETHRVTTKDGYILEMHRIPYGNHPRRDQPVSLQARVPVILFHGNAQSSADWVINYPVEDALGFYLADCGYDVWLVNQRGNDYSKRHVKFTTADSDFWQYSVHELGVYDIPAFIDYATSHTGHPKVNFIGFSLSNSALMVALSKNPFYNSKIAGAVLMAPGGIYYEGFLFNLARVVAPVASLYEVFSGVLGGIPAIPPVATNLMHRVLPIICHRKVDIFGVCLLVLKALFGVDFGLITKDKMSSITSVAPSPFSVGTIIHGLQQAGFGEFTEYDFGIRQNKVVYGKPRPPVYNLTNVQIPIAIMVGPADYHASPRDAKNLARRLPNVVDFHYVPYRFFRHLDFCYGRNSGKLVYGRVVSYLDSFSNNNTHTYIYH